eukprot:TRINITY_DN2728_c0_g2_i1.p3 TRINITY_DN2728_c0_g2~~TRINITY_DN2728_c0_g2_i1.p3  ORF type:complete len:113 (-),score=0.73 TRINITY_DN2728_c0_g2_i1:2841-3179(-)
MPSLCSTGFCSRWLKSLLNVLGQPSGNCFTIFLPLAVDRPLSYVITIFKFDERKTIYPMMKLISTKTKALAFQAYVRFDCAKGMISVAQLKSSASEVKSRDNGLLTPKVEGV